MVIKPALKEGGCISQSDWNHFPLAVLLVPEGFLKLICLLCIGKPTSGPPGSGSGLSCVLLLGRVLHCDGVRVTSPALPSFLSYLEQTICHATARNQSIAQITACRTTVPADFPLSLFYHPTSPPFPFKAPPLHICPLSSFIQPLQRHISSLCLTSVALRPHLAQSCSDPLEIVFALSILSCAVCAPSGERHFGCHLVFFAPRLQSQLLMQDLCEAVLHFLGDILHCVQAGTSLGRKQDIPYMTKLIACWNAAISH